MRFNQNRCSKCADRCPHAAINLEGGLSIDYGACTECMLCVSECPSGGLDLDPKDFYFLLTKLKKAPMPVVGCKVKPEMDAHAHTFCLGSLSEERLLIFMVLLDAPVQINLTGCASCKNRGIVDVLKKRLEAIEQKISLKESEARDYTLPPAPYTLHPTPYTLHAARYTLNKITLVENKSALQYEDVPCDRRGFFTALKKITMESAAGFFDNSTERESMNYSDKTLPSGRKLLNKVYSVVSEKPSKGLLDNYYYDVKVEDNCDVCFSCTGMCPAGALKSTYDLQTATEEPSYQGPSKLELFFFPSLCVGCGLCSDFCMSKSISVVQGFKGDSPFKMKCVKTVVIGED